MSKANIEEMIKPLADLDSAGMYLDDFLLTWDRSDDEIYAVFQTAQILMQMRKNNISPKVFESGLSAGTDSITLDSYATIWKDRHDERIVRAFQRYDADGDLKVTFEEFSAPMKDFVKNHDANGDGVLTRAERGGGKYHRPGWGGPKRAGMPDDMPAPSPDGDDD